MFLFLLCLVDFERETKAMKEFEAIFDLRNFLSCVDVRYIDLGSQKLAHVVSNRGTILI